MRLRHFGLILLLLVGALPLIAAGVFSIRRANRTTVEAIRIGNERVAVRSARRLEAYVDDQLEILRAVAVAMAPTVKVSPEQAERVVKNYLILYPHLRSMDVVGKDCLELATARLDGKPRKRCGEPAVDAALAGKIYRGDVRLSPDFAPIMTVGIPLDLAGEPIGAAVAELDLVGLWPAVNEIRVGDKGYARLVGRDGTLLAHGDPEERRRVFLRHKDPRAERVRAAGSAGARYVNDQGREVLALARTIDTLGWTIIVEQPIGEAYKAARLMQRDLGIIIAVAVGLALVLGVTFGRKPVRWIEAMRRHTREVARGNLDARVHVPRPIQELRLLAESLNEMASELKRLQEELQSRERLNTFARVAAGLAHDLQQPINAIRSACELAAASDDEAHTRELVKDVADRQVPRLDRYVRDLRRISQEGKIPLELATVDPMSLAKRIAADAAVNPKWTGIEFSAEGVAAPVMVDESLVTRAISNLVGNAADATMGRKPARVTIEVEDSQADTLTIAVRDTGAGMSAERLEQIFSHDFRSDKRGSGIGLGLGVAKQVAAAHGGSLTAESRQGEGSVFRIVIPRPKPPETGVQRSPEPRSGSRAHAS